MYWQWEIIKIENNQQDIVLVYHIDSKDFHDQSSKIRFHKTMTGSENDGWEQMKRIHKKIASPSYRLKIIIIIYDIIIINLWVFLGLRFYLVHIFRLKLSLPDNHFWEHRRRLQIQLLQQSNLLLQKSQENRQERSRPNGRQSRLSMKALEMIP